jgi:hypothetical protein
MFLSNSEINQVGCCFQDLKIQPALNSQLVPAHLQQPAGAEPGDSGPPQDSQDKQVSKQYDTQSCGSGIRCLFDPWIQDPGWVKTSGSGMNNSDHHNF